MNESDSDFVITDFRGGVESDDDCIIVSSPNKKTRIHYDVILIPGDGHCIAHCFSSHFKEPMDKVPDRLDKDFRENLTMYCCFSDLTKEEILEAVFLYITEKRYSNSTTDLFLHVFSNIYNANVIIMHDNSKYGDIIIGEEFEQDIKLYKYHEHYDLLKFTEVSSGSLTQPLVVKDDDEHVK